MFFKNWTTRQKASVVFNERELRLISRLEGVENMFPGLKKAIAMANSKYLESLKQAETKKQQAQDQARAKTDRESDLRQSISSTLKRLSTTPADQ